MPKVGCQKEVNKVNKITVTVHVLKAQIINENEFKVFLRVKELKTANFIRRINCVSMSALSSMSSPAVPVQARLAFLQGVTTISINGIKMKTTEARIKEGMSQCTRTPVKT